jgi:hypothetical protein
MLLLLLLCIWHKHLKGLRGPSCVAKELAQASLVSGDGGGSAAVLKCLSGISVVVLHA